jgi:hypothetical protein
VALGPCAKIAGEWLQRATRSHSRHNLAVEPLVCARSESHCVAPVAGAQPVYYKLRSLFEVFKAPTTLKTPHSDPLVDPFCAEYSSLNNAALKSDFVNLPELCSYARKCAEVCSPPRTSMPAAIRGFCRCHTSLSSRGFCGFIEFTLHNSTSSAEMIGREAAPGLVESKITFYKIRSLRTPLVVPVLMRRLASPRPYLLSAL